MTGNTRARLERLEREAQAREQAEIDAETRAEVARIVAEIQASDVEPTEQEAAEIEAFLEDVKQNARRRYGWTG